MISRVSRQWAMSVIPVNFPIGGLFFVSGGIMRGSGEPVGVPLFSRGLKADERVERGT